MRKKAKELSKAMMDKNKKKKMNAGEKKMGHSADSAAHKRMVGRKSGY